MSNAEARTPSSPNAASGERVIGLIAEPGLAEQVARDVAADLPDLLSSAIGENGSTSARWRVEIVRHALSLDTSGDLRLLGVASGQGRHHWYAAIVLTELPRRMGTQPVVADCVPAKSVALVSLTALGAFGIRRKTRTLLTHLITNCLAPAASKGTGARPSGLLRQPALPHGYRIIDEREGQDKEGQDYGHGAGANVDLGGAGLHYVLPERRGQMRLLAGMVGANRPWRLVPSLAPAVSGALAGAAFGVFYSNIWQLADASTLVRQACVAVLSTGAMAAWLVVAHGLWERTAGSRSRRFLRLYNVATVLTVSSGVAIMFVLLFAAALLGASIVIPSSYLSSTLGHPVGLFDFAALAWQAACLGTLSGALGSGLADEEAVRRAAFSGREREAWYRRATAEDRAESDEDRAESDEEGRPGRRGRVPRQERAGRLRRLRW